MFAVRNGKKATYLNPPAGSEDEYESHIVVDVSAEIATVWTRKIYSDRFTRFAGAGEAQR